MNAEKMLDFSSLLAQMKNMKCKDHYVLVIWQSDRYLVTR
jgi:hypothetical protein